MKQLMFSLTLIASSALANPAIDDGPIYESLNVASQNVAPAGTLGVSRREKSVGGLSCLRVQVIYPGAIPRFQCFLAERHDDAAIYAALLTPEREMIANNDQVFVKEVGGLRCSRTLGEAEAPTYACALP